MTKPKSTHGLTIPVDPGSCEIKLGTRRIATGDDSDRLITLWSGALIYPAETVGYELDSDTGGSEYDLEDVVLAEGRFATIDLWRFRHSHEAVVFALDGESADFEVFAGLFDDDDNVKDDFGDYVPGLLICERVSVPLAFRGRKFGPLLMAGVIAELAESRLPVCTPGAFDVPDEDRDGVIDRNQVIWGTFGFERYTDDIWWLPDSPEVAYENIDRYAKLASEAEPITLA
jgi:hypothetical protein